MMTADPSAAHAAAPRINSSMMSAHAGRTVRLVGQRMPQRSGSELLLKASDNGQVEVTINPSEHFPRTEYVEVLGQVSPNGQHIMAYVVSDFGNNFDLAAYNKLVDVRAQFPDIF